MAGKPFDPWRCRPPTASLDLAQQLPNFETLAQVEERRQKLIRVLERGDDECCRMADRLGRCRDGHRCCNAICPICARRFRRWLVASLLVAEKRLRGQAGKRFRYVVSLSPTWLHLPPGELGRFDIKAATARVHQHLRRVGRPGEIWVAGWDFSFNEHSARKWPPFWQPHIYALTTATDKGALLKLLRRLYRRDMTTPRPVKIYELKDPFEQISYLWKPIFSRRVSYLWKSSFVRRVSYRDARGRKNTRKVSLKSDQVRELMLFMSRISPTERLIVRGMRRRGCRFELSN